MQKILLIGSTGILGKKVLEELVAGGKYEIGILVRNLAGRNFRNIYNLKLFEGDVIIKHSCDSAVIWADIVINCSGYVSYRRNDTDRLHLLNVAGVQNIAEACERYGKKLVHTSSAGVYGSTAHPFLFKEDTYEERAYKTQYFYSKIEAEKIIARSSISWIMLRPGSIVSKERSTLKKLYNFYQKGFIPGLKGGASFVLAEDVARACSKAADLLTERTGSLKMIFNLGGHNLTFREIFRHFKNRKNRNTLFLNNHLLHMLSIFNDFVLFPCFTRSIITQENYRTGNGYTFVDSSQAIQELDYKISTLERTIQEII